MTYIRPTSPVPRVSSVKPVVSKELENEEDPDLILQKPNEKPFTPSAPDVERRKRRDRRNQTKNPLLETRASKDRRKSNQKGISITI